MKVILVAVYVTLAIPQQITNPSPVLHRPCVSFLPCRGSNEFERIQSAEGCPWSICKIHSCDPDVDKSRQRPTVWGWKRVAAIPRSRFMLDLTSSELIYARFSAILGPRRAKARVRQEGDFSRLSTKHRHYFCQIEVFSRAFERYHQCIFSVWRHAIVNRF